MGLISSQKLISSGHFDFCVVGAGASGLTMSYELLKADKSVLLIERDERVGGLAKSHNYNGHIFDTGPKRFHTDDKVVEDFIRSAMDMLQIGRSTKVFFSDKYFTWPLSSKEIFKMPVGLAVRSAFDLLRRKPPNDPESFHEAVRAKYGEAIYQSFFKNYTEKFLRWDPEDLHADWAVTGINRTVVDNRFNVDSLLDIAISLALPNKIETEFMYPTEGGFGGFYDKLFELCNMYEAFEVRLNSSIKTLNDKPEYLEITLVDGSAFTCNRLVWSGNLNSLADLVGSDEARLPYLNTVFYNLVCRQDGLQNNRAQWIYVSSKDTLISRITCMREFAPYTCPDGYYNVICELTDSQTNPKYFAHAKDHKEQIIRELIEMRFLRGAAYVEDIFINPVIDTYPVYHKQYLRNFALIAKSIHKKISRVHLLGRSGAFWYNNSDHSVRMAIDMAAKLTKDDPSDFDFRGYFGGATAPLDQNEQHPTRSK